MVWAASPSVAFTAASGPSDGATAMAPFTFMSRFVDAQLPVIADHEPPELLDVMLTNVGVGVTSEVGAALLHFQPIVGVVDVITTKYRVDAASAYGVARVNVGVPSAHAPTELPATIEVSCVPGAEPPSDHSASENAPAVEPEFVELALRNRICTLTSVEAVDEVVNDWASQVVELEFTHAPSAIWS